jgi:2-polyprenyl-3-methyl-5-hydroxy-6-metoxy-1,4-benzoquinol methylase
MSTIVSRNERIGTRQRGVAIAIAEGSRENGAPLLVKEETLMGTHTGTSKLNPVFVYNTLNAYQQTAALRTAIELDVFTVIGQGVDTVPALAKRCGGTERGLRILCDYLTIIHFLTKEGQRYALTADSAAFLDKRSPSYQGTTARFLTLPETVMAFMHLTDAIRTGQPFMQEGQGSIAEENPIWVEFARSMAPMTTPTAEEVARILDAGRGKNWKVLDIAAGHGTFGITLAKHNLNAQIFAQDWAAVLEVAAENARAAGVSARYHRLPGSAFEVDFGTGYDVVLITNFLHHYDAATIETLMRKVLAALGPEGVAVTLDFIPNEDRVTPERAAGFAMMMLGMTPAGDAYTFSEYEQMFRKAGFSSNELQQALPGGHGVIISRK